MKRHLWGLALAGVLIGIAGCAQDPTAEIAGTPARIVPSYSKLFLFPGDSIQVIAEVVDEQGANLGILATVSSSDAAVAAVRDEAKPPWEQTRFWVRADGVGGATITLAAEGLSTEILVSVFPLVFEGDVSVVTTASLDTVVINVGSSGLLFVPGETEVLIDGTAARIVAESDQELKVIPRTIDGLTDVALTIETLVFLEGTEYEASITELEAAAPITVRGETNEPGNDDPSTATPIAVAGLALEGFVDENDVDDYFTFTLAAGADVTITTVFDGGGVDPDIDVYLLDADGGGFCALDDCAMVTGSMPELATITLSAGTYTVLVEWWDSGADDPPHWYRIEID